MIHQYLMFENPGVSPKEGFMIFGVSTTRDAGVEGTIGQFGTGTKQAIALCLRHNICPIVFCGTLRLTFQIKPLPVDDGLFAKNYGQVWVRLSGKENGKSVNREMALGFTVEVGFHDWDELVMAFREFTSNALDRSLREIGSHQAAKVHMVDGDQVRAKDGYTRVFIPAILPEVTQFCFELPKRFLQFGEKESLGKTVLMKRARSLTDSPNATMVYRQGVFVREVDEEYVSLLDYNLGPELELDESRNVNDSTVKEAAAVALACSEPTILARVFRSLIAKEKSFESELSSYRLQNASYYSRQPFDERRANWQAAWTMAAGPNAVACHGSFSTERVRHKGFVPIELEAANWIRSFQTYGIPTDIDILTADERAGKTFEDSTPEVDKALSLVWKTLLRLEMTEGKSKPKAGTFYSIMDEESQTYGLYRDDCVYIHKDISAGNSPMLSKVMLEEVAHYVTGSADMSRDFQDYAFRVAAALIR